MTTQKAPVYGDDFLPEHPALLFEQGRYDESINIMTGYNTDEGSLLVPPYINDSASYEHYVRGLVPSLTPRSLQYIADTLYPAVFDGSHGYYDQHGRVNLTYADAMIVCNARFLDTAAVVNPQRAQRRVNTRFAYRFAGIHAQDTASTFYTSGSPPGVNTTLATLMQQYFGLFAETGAFNEAGLPRFTRTNGSVVQVFSDEMVGPVSDEDTSRRCRYWRSVLSSR